MPNWAARIIDLRGARLHRASARNPGSGPKKERLIVREARLYVLAPILRGAAGSIALGSAVLLWIRGATGRCSGRSFLRLYLLARA